MEVNFSSLLNLVVNDFVLAKLWKENLAWFLYYKENKETNGMSYTKYMAYFDLVQKCQEMLKRQLDKNEEKIIKEFVDFYFK